MPKSEYHKLSEESSLVFLRFCSFCVLVITPGAVYLYDDSKDGCSMNVITKVHPTPLNTIMA